jgi:NADH dehydrogenase FAD-containing subunit
MMFVVVGGGLSGVDFFGVLSADFTWAQSLNKFRSGTS